MSDIHLKTTVDEDFINRLIHSVALKKGLPADVLKLRFIEETVFVFVYPCRLHRFLPRKLKFGFRVEGLCIEGGKLHCRLKTSSATVNLAARILTPIFKKLIPDCECFMENRKMLHVKTGLPELFPEDSEISLNLLDRSFCLEAGLNVTKELLDSLFDMADSDSD